MKVRVTLTCEPLGTKEAIDKGLRYCGLEGKAMDVDGSHVFVQDVDKVSTVQEAVDKVKTQLGYSAEADPIQGAVYRLQDVKSEILEA